MGRWPRPGRRASWSPWWPTPWPAGHRAHTRHGGRGDRPRHRLVPPSTPGHRRGGRCGDSWWRSISDPPCPCSPSTSGRGAGPSERPTSSASPPRCGARTRTAGLRGGRAHRAGFTFGQLPQPPPACPLRAPFGGWKRSATAASSATKVWPSTQSHAIHAPGRCAWATRPLRARSGPTPTPADRARSPTARPRRPGRETAVSAIGLLPAAAVVVAVVSLAAAAVPADSVDQGFKVGPRPGGGGPAAGPRTGWVGTGPEGYGAVIRVRRRGAHVYPTT